MLRALAILLINLISFGLMAPAISADTGTELPPCCRAHGKHHCAMRRAMEMTGARSGPSIQSVSEKCPFGPEGTPIAVAPAGFFPATAFVFCGTFSSQPDRVAQTEAQYRVSFSRSRQKRGPPSSLFS